MPETEDQEFQDALARLHEIIRDRARAGDTENSYTAVLLANGPEKCAKKFGEEAIEAVLACASGDRNALIRECADTLYHLLVMLEARQISLEEVYREIEGRMEMSGLEEKARRGEA